MMIITCPACNKLHTLEGDDLPEHACDTQDFECTHCQLEMEIGWYGTAEIRNIKDRKVNIADKELETVDRIAKHPHIDKNIVYGRHFIKHRDHYLNNVSKSATSAKPVGVVSSISDLGYPRVAITATDLKVGDLLYTNPTNTRATIFMLRKENEQLIEAIRKLPVTDWSEKAKELVREILAR